MAGPTRAHRRNSIGHAPDSSIPWRPRRESLGKAQGALVALAVLGTKPATPPRRGWRRSSVDLTALLTPSKADGQEPEKDETIEASPIATVLASWRSNTPLKTPQNVGVASTPEEEEEEIGNETSAGQGRARTLSPKCLFKDAPPAHVRPLPNVQERRDSLTRSQSLLKLSESAAKKVSTVPSSPAYVPPSRRRLQFGPLAPQTTKLQTRIVAKRYPGIKATNMGRLAPGTVQVRSRILANKRPPPGLARAQSLLPGRSQSDQSMTKTCLHSEAEYNRKIKIGQHPIVYPLPPSPTKVMPEWRDLRRRDQARFRRTIGLDSMYSKQEKTCKAWRSRSWRAQVAKKDG